VPLIVLLSVQNVFSHRCYLQTIPANCQSTHPCQTINLFTSAVIKQHLNHEGALLVFPADEISRLRPQGVRDTKWRSGFYRIAKQHQAPILPVFIDAKNSPLFYSLSMLYKPLSTVLLVKEMFKQRNITI
jgi:putative hemolysin